MPRRRTARWILPALIALVWLGLAGPLGSIGGQLTSVQEERLRCLPPRQRRVDAGHRAAARVPDRPVAPGDPALGGGRASRRAATRRRRRPAGRGRGHRGRRRRTDRRCLPRIPVGGRAGSAGDAAGRAGRRRRTPALVASCAGSTASRASTPSSPARAPRSPTSPAASPGSTACCCSPRSASSC